MKHVKKPISYPLEKEFVADYVKVSEDSDVFHIERLIKVATKEAENEIGMDIAYTENSITYSDFTGSTIEVNEGNFISIISITGDDVSVGFSRVIDDGYKFKVELENSIDVDTLVLKYYAGFASDTEDTANLEIIKQYILVRCDDMFGPERSSYSFNALRSNGNKASDLLASLKGFY